MLKSPQAAEAEGIEVCEKETKDGRTVAYKTGKQLEKDKQAKGERKAEREKVGAKGRGRLSKIHRDKILAIRSELANVLGKDVAPASQKETKQKTKEVPKREKEQAPKYEVPSKEKTEQAPSHKEDSGGSKIEAALAKSGRLPEVSKPKSEIKWEKGGAIEKRSPEIQAEIANEIKAEVERLNQGGPRREGLVFPDDPLKQKELNEKVAPRPDKPETYDDKVVTDSLRAAYKRIVDEHPLRVSPQFPDIYNEMRKDLPGLTKNQFKAVAKKGRENEILDFYHINSPGAVKDGDSAIFTSMGTLYYLGLRDN